MAEVIKIKKGLDIKLLGEAEKVLDEKPSGKYAVKPTDFHGVFPKLMVKEGDKVKAGSPLFYNKHSEKVKFAAPVSGEVVEIKRGAKRVLEEIVIEVDSMISFEQYKKIDISGAARNEVVDALLESGIWPVIRQRPYGIIANPDDSPKAIYISCFSTAPLAQDVDFTLNGKKDYFQAGIDALAKLTDGEVNLNLYVGSAQNGFFESIKNVRKNYFSGPHPAGNIGVQIHHIEAINKGDVVWYIDAQHVATLGKFILEAIVDFSRVIALTGSEILKPRYFKVMGGASINELVEGNVKNGNLRYISGNVLTGKKILRNGYLGYYDSQITVIPEGDYFEFLGWSMPRFNKFSTSKSYFSWLFPAKKYRLDTNLNGGVRAIVVTGKFENVFPMDIYPLQLVKAILIKDLDLMEQLGIYEVDEEDFALCEFVDTSKMDLQKIVREGLDFVRKEMS